jgi:hypothetical protein
MRSCALDNWRIMNTTHAHRSEKMRGKAPKLGDDQAVHVVFHKRYYLAEVQRQCLALQSRADVADDVHVERLRLLRVPAEQRA